MRFAFYLALRNLLRHPGRNLLYILGISITAALLMDMVLLSGGIRVSLARLLKQLGYELRMSPRGTLPFETAAQIEDFSKYRDIFYRDKNVATVDAILAAAVELNYRNENFSAFAMGIVQAKPIIYTVQEGHDPKPFQEEILINQYLARDKKIRAGDWLELSVSGQYESLGGSTSVRRRVSGVAFFHVDAEGQYSISLPLGDLQQLMGVEDRDPVSLMMIKLHDSSRAEALNEEINRQFPQISSYSITTVIDAVDKQLSYFKQFAIILGGISLIVTFVLVLIITTISFHDRIGEIALLRAIGLSRKTVFSAVLFEGILTSLAAAVIGFGLGKVVSIYLDFILKSAPGLPESFSFFVMEPDAILRAVLTLLLTGFFAGLYPAAAAMRLPVATTLREEIL